MTTRSLDERFLLVRRLVEEAGDAPRFRPDPVPRELLEDILEIATGRYAGRYQEQPWRFLVVVGEERERILLRVADALGRRWGLGAVRPRGLASEAVLRAPALLLVFSKVPSSEGLDAVNHVALATQNVVLLCAAAGLATHRIFGTNLVPEAVLDWAGSLLGPEIRSGEFVSMVAVGYPEAPAPPPGGGTRGEWVGVPDAARIPPPPPAPPPSVPAAVLRSPGSERVVIADPYDYNREQIAGLLRVADYHVDAHADGQSLLSDLGRGVSPDLYIISDNLPDTSGFELVRALRQRSGGPVPLIVTTARRDAAFRIGGLAAGVDYYLRKPVNPIELYTATRILLEQHRRGEELARANDELSRLLVELRAAQARLVQQAKMASLGQLVAGVAHEVNTPLGAVVSNNDLFVRCFTRLRRRVDELGLGADPVVARDLGAVTELLEVTRIACERIMNIVRELRVFARLDEADRKSIDLHEGLESTLVLINHLIKGRIEVRREYGKLPPVECHPNQINQVFMNLLVNACQAMPEGGGVLTLRTAHDPEGRRVMVAITDNGSGIPREVLGRIFDPGFTTKGAGVGTGLGLSICYQIVEAHGGEIVVESQVGRGTTFTIWLPEAPEGATG